MRIESGSPYDDCLRRIVPEHISHMEPLPSVTTASQRLAHAGATSRQHDVESQLSRSETVVTRRPLRPDSSPETFVHTHPNQYTSRIVAMQKSETQQAAALRLFLDCFYYTCGFRAWYQRGEFKGIITTFTCEEQERPEFTEEEQKKYVRCHAVMNHLQHMPGIYKKDIRWLVGRKSEFHKLHTAHHSMNVRAMAVYLERLVKVAQPRQRGIAITKAFGYLTGYVSFEEAYNNETETRRFTDEGIKGPSPLYAGPNDDDETDDEIVDADIQFISV